MKENASPQHITDGMHRATPWTGDFLVSLSALQSCRQQDLRCNLSSKALLTRPIHTESSTNGDMKSPCRAKHQCRWGDGHQHDMRRFPVCYACEPNLHIGQSALPVRCISQHASPSIVLHSSPAGSPRRLAFLLPEYSSRRGGVQSGPVPACVPLPWEGNHTLSIRVSPAPLLASYIHACLQWTRWPLLSAAGFLVSHDHVLTGQSWRAGMSGSSSVYIVETSC